MITGHVPAVRVPPDHAASSRPAAVPARGNVEERRDLDPAPSAHRPATPSSVPPDADLGGPGTARDPAQRDAESASSGAAVAVTPDTILRWHRDIVRGRWAARSMRGKTGRPATRRNTRALVLRLARENPGWGYRRIHGELAGLGVKVAPSTAWEILKNAGIDPAPRRTGPAWSQFLRSQADAILACDFFTADLLDGTQAYVLDVIEHASRRIRVLGGHSASDRGMDRPAGPQPPHGPRRTGSSGQVHDPRSRLQLHSRVRHCSRRCRGPDRTVQRPDAPDERDRRTLDRGMPT